MICSTFRKIWKYFNPPKEKKPTLIVAVDVDYRENDATAAAVAFRDWKDSRPAYVVTTTVSPIAAYEPGAFYKRELPCILKVLTKLSQETPEAIGCVVVDGYVWLEEGHQGLGYKLYEALDKKIPVVGVAKTFYKDAKATQVCRGDSKNPLYVTSEGMNVTDAATAVSSMYGDFRLPTLLKLVDHTCRGRNATKT